MLGISNRNIEQIFVSDACSPNLRSSVSHFTIPGVYRNAVHILFHNWQFD